MVLEIDGNNVWCGQGEGCLKRRAAVIYWGGEGSKMWSQAKLEGIISWGLEDGLRSLQVFLKNWCSATPFFLMPSGSFRCLLFFLPSSERKVRSKNKLWAENGKKKKKKPSASARIHTSKEVNFVTKIRLYTFFFFLKKRKLYISCYLKKSSCEPLAEMNLFLQVEYWWLFLSAFMLLRNPFQPLYLGSGAVGPVVLPLPFCW